MRQFLDRRPDVDSSAYIDVAATVIGAVSVGADSSFWPGAVARGDVHEIRVGQRTSIQDNAVLHVTHDGPYRPGGIPLVVGDDVTVGHSAVLHACTVGNACLIGIGAIVLDGAVVEPESMIAAGALVAPGKRVERGTLWMGNPARYARDLSDQEIKKLYYSARQYVKLKNQYLAAPE